MTVEYHTPLSKKVFEEVRTKSIQLWREIDTDNDKYGYASEKIDRIKHLKNIADNGMYIISMFDIENQQKLAIKLTTQANQEIAERLVAGGTFVIHNPFLWQI